MSGRAIGGLFRPLLTGGWGVRLGLGRMGRGGGGGTVSAASLGETAAGFFVDLVALVVGGEPGQGALNDGGEEGEGVFGGVGLGLLLLEDFSLGGFEVPYWRLEAEGLEGGEEGLEGRFLPEMGEVGGWGCHVGMYLSAWSG